MNSGEWDFPIAGATVSHVLRGQFNPEEVWELALLDVPTGELPAPTLDALRAEVDAGGCLVSTAALCKALDGAPQLWVLDIRLASNREVQLYIEDGEVFEIHLERA